MFENQTTATPPVVQNLRRQPLQRHVRKRVGPDTRVFERGTAAVAKQFLPDGKIQTIHTGVDAANAFATRPRPGVNHQYRHQRLGGLHSRNDSFQILSLPIGARYLE